MKQEFAKIRGALEEYLRAINENTAEIQVLFDYLNEMEMKVEKFSLRLDQLQLNVGKPLEKQVVLPLNKIEKKLFLVFYTEETPLTYTELAMKSQIPSSLIPDYVSSLIGKGVPLARSFAADQFFFKLDPHFKELQAKENLVNLSLQSFME